MKSLLSSDFVAIIDEPENHLHPELQRSVLPGLVAAFPNCQLIIASHNPFVVTSVRDSAVCVLSYVEGGVESQELSNVDRSASANKVLTDVLGVPAPIPIWVEDEINSVVVDFSEADLTVEGILELRARLARLGIGHLFPDAISRIVTGRELQ